MKKATLALVIGVFISHLSYANETSYEIQGNNGNFTLVADTLDGNTVAGGPGIYSLEQFNIDVKRNAAGLLATKADISTNQNAITSLNSGLSANQNAINTLDSDVSANKSAINTLGSDVSANKSAINTLDSDVSANKSAINTLDSDVSANKSAINTLGSDVSANKSAINTLGSDVSANKSAINTLNSGLGANQSAINTLGSDVSANKSAINTLGSDVSANQNAINTLGSDVSANQNAMTFMHSDVQVAKNTGTYARSRADAAIANAETNKMALEKTNQAVAAHTAELANHESRINALETQAVNSNSFSRLKSQVDENRQRASAGIAGVAAMANIPQVTQGATFSVGAGAGTTDGESAMAVGFSARATESTIIKASVSDDSQQNFVIGAGAAYQW